MALLYEKLPPPIIGLSYLSSDHTPVFISRARWPEVPSISFDALGTILSGESPKLAVLRFFLHRNYELVPISGSKSLTVI